MRIFHVKSYFPGYQRMRIGTDASPLGLEGGLSLTVLYWDISATKYKRMIFDDLGSRSDNLNVNIF